MRVSEQPHFVPCGDRRRLKQVRMPNPAAFDCGDSRQSSTNFNFARFLLSLGMRKGNEEGWRAALLTAGPEIQKASQEVLLLRGFS
jgi:hypothetical protein